MRISTFRSGAVLTVMLAMALGAEESKDKKPADDSAGPAKFYGTISAVDVEAKTFTIDKQTYSVVPETQMTKNDKSATMTDAVVGEPARGTYVKASDGKLNVTKVRFGKKPGGGGGGKGKKKDKEKEPPAESAK